MLAAVGLALVACVSALAQVKPIDLSPETFDSVVNGHQVALVMFYAPWCGHCRDMEPAMTALATYYANNDNVAIARVDADAHVGLRRRFGVSAFPTIKFFPMGKNPQPEDVDCGRDFESLRDYIKDRLGTPKDKLPVENPSSNVVVLDDIKFGSVALDPQRTVLVLFGTSWCMHCRTLKPIYESLAGVFRGEPGVVIASIDCDANKAMADRYGISEYPSLRLFGRASKVPVKYEGSRTLEDLVSFVNQHAGTARLANGDVSREYGLNGDMNEIVRKFFATPGLRNNLINDAMNRAKQSNSAADKIYVDALTRIRDNGPDWVAVELARLNEIVSSCTIDTPRADHYRIKRNILTKVAELGNIPMGRGVLL